MRFCLEFRFSKFEKISNSIEESRKYEELIRKQGFMRFTFPLSAWRNTEQAFFNIFHANGIYFCIMVFGEHKALWSTFYRSNVSYKLIVAIYVEGALSPAFNRIQPLVE